MRNLYRGFTLLEMLAALSIGVVMTIGLAGWINNSLEETKGQQAAYHQAQVAAGAARYIAQNFNTLATEATTTVPAMRTFADIQNAGFLSANMNPENAYGQIPCLLILANATGGLDALLVTEGANTNSSLTKNIAYIAAQSGVGGGYITGDTPPVARGAHGSWSVPVADYVTKSCTGTAAGRNNLASALFFDSAGAVTQDFLYRGTVPGHPELNAMTTPLHMRSVVAEGTSDALCMVGDATSWGRIAVNAQGNVMSCQQGIWKRQGSSYWKDPVASFAALSALPAADNQVGDVRIANDIQRAFAWDGLGWRALAVDENGDMRIPRDLRVANNLVLEKTVVRNQACLPSDNGVVARDAGGIIVTCQAGFWRSASTIESIYSDHGRTTVLNNPLVSPPDPTAPPIIWDVHRWTATITKNIPSPVKDGALIIAHGSGMICRCQIADIPSPALDSYLVVHVTIYDRDTGAALSWGESGTSMFIHNRWGIQSTGATKWVRPNANGYQVQIKLNWRVDTADGRWSDANTAIGGVVTQETPLRANWMIDVIS